MYDLINKGEKAHIQLEMLLHRLKNIERECYTINQMIAELGYLPINEQEESD